MSDILWLENHPICGNVVEQPRQDGTPLDGGTQESVLCQNSQNSDRAFVLEWTRARRLTEVREILVELPRSNYYEDSWQAGKSSEPSEPHPSTYSTNLEVEAL
jgi:hypothetical protein